MVATDSGGRYASVDIAVFYFAAGIFGSYPGGNLWAACYFVLFCEEIFIIARNFR
jgi:hypothetical protein